MTPGARLSWLEVDAGAIRRNAGQFRLLIGPDRKLMAVVKANAYGHGLLEASRAALEGGADWLGVFDLDEALALESGGVKAPVLIMGDLYGEALAGAIRSRFRITVPSMDMASRVVEAVKKTGGLAAVHLKIETGTNRQGMRTEEAVGAAGMLTREERVCIEGAYTHYANIEDTTDHSYAMGQLDGFRKALAALETAGVKPPIRHTACSAAAILMEETYFEMVRAGIGIYGLWPSKETRVSAGMKGGEGPDLKPALTWKTRVIQVKEVPEGAFVGYGCTFRATRPMKIAVLPIGYYNGYDRKFSGAAYVLIRGKRAPVTGRVCMNLTMVNVTDIEGAAAGDEVVLLGKQGDDSITAEQLAALAGTINYEIVARIDPAAPRVPVG